MSNCFAMKQDLPWHWPRQISALCVCQPAPGATPALVGHLAEVEMVLHWQELLTFLSWKRHVCTKQYFSSTRDLKAHKNKLFEAECKWICWCKCEYQEWTTRRTRLGEEEMDMGGSRNRRAALSRTPRFKCYPPAFPPVLFSLGLYCVCFTLLFYLSKASCARIHSWAVRTHRYSLPSMFFPVVQSPASLREWDSFGHRCSLWSKGSLQCGSFVAAAAKAKAQSFVIFERWMSHLWPALLPAFTDRICAAFTAGWSAPFLSLSPQMSWQPRGMWSCCITCEHCWVLSLCAGCLAKGPSRNGRL